MEKEKHHYLFDLKQKNYVTYILEKELSNEQYKRRQFNFTNYSVFSQPCFLRVCSLVGRYFYYVYSVGITLLFYLNVMDSNQCPCKQHRRISKNILKYLSALSIRIHTSLSE